MPKTQIPRKPPLRTSFLLNCDNPETLRRRLAVVATHLSVADRLRLAVAINQIRDNEARAEAVRENESSEAA